MDVILNSEIVSHVLHTVYEASNIYLHSCLKHQTKSIFSSNDNLISIKYNFTSRSLYDNITF